MKRAFSLTELMVVLAIISMIIKTMQVYIQHKVTQANIRNIVECVKIYEVATTMFYLHNNGDFPSDASEKNLENVGSLKPYCPTNFNTKKMLQDTGCKDITFFEYSNKYSSVYAIKISTGDNANLSLEIKKQLLKFAPEDQIGVKESIGGASPSGDSDEESSPTLFFLKEGNAVYI